MENRAKGAAEQRGSGSGTSRKRPSVRGATKRSRAEADTVAIPDSSTDFVELTGNADKIMETVAFLEQLAQSTNLCTVIPRRDAADPPENPPERRLREVYYHLMACDLRLTRPNYDKCISVIASLQKAFKKVLIVLRTPNYARLRLFEVHMDEERLRLDARQNKFDALDVYWMYVTSIHEVIKKPTLDRREKIGLKELPYKLMELEDSLINFLHEHGVNRRKHNLRCMLEKHHLEDKKFFDSIFAAYPGLAENVWDWLKHAYRSIRPPSDVNLGLSEISDILTTAYVELLSWDATTHRPFQFPDSLVLDRKAIVRLGEEYSYMLYVNAALIVVNECCDISSDWKGHLKQRFFETVSSVRKRRVPRTIGKLGTVATQFLKSKQAQFDEMHLLNRMNALNEDTSDAMFRSRSSLRRFCSVLINEPTKIPLQQIEKLQMVKGEAVQMMAKFITIIDCNRRAMGHRYMDMIRQMHNARMPVSTSAKRVQKSG